ncbi:MAG: ABC transporter permease [Bilophila wadsworthia]
MTRRLAGKGCGSRVGLHPPRVHRVRHRLRLGIPLIFMASKVFQRVSIPFHLIKPMPPISWVSLSILWLGIGEEPKIFIIAIGAFVPIVLNAYNGIRSSTRNCMMWSAWRRPHERIVESLPAAVPSIFAGLQFP